MQMAELFNHRSSMAGKIPCGFFNYAFGFEGSTWAQDASSTKLLAMDGCFITLFDLRIERQPLALTKRVIDAVPSTWDPTAIARCENKIQLKTSVLRSISDFVRHVEFPRK